MANAGTAMVFLEIAADTLLQIARLAHIQNLIIGIKIPIHPGQTGECSHFG
jgi:hypothetical protein